MAMSYTEDVPHEGQDISLVALYGVRMSDFEGSPGSRFATLIKDARRRRGWTQERLAEESRVGRTTIIRWESGGTVNPVPEQVRAVCKALGIDPREVPIALGLVTREEFELPPPEQVEPRPEMLDALIEEYQHAKSGREKERIADAIETLVAGLRARRAEQERAAKRPRRTRHAG